MMTIFMILGWQMDDTIVRYGSIYGCLQLGFDDTGD